MLQEGLGHNSSGVKLRIEARFLILSPSTVAKTACAGKLSLMPVAPLGT